MFYALNNTHATEFSVGFSNTWFVAAFATKSERDSYVQSCNFNKAVRAVTRKDARKYDSTALVYALENGKFVHSFDEVEI